MPETITRGIPGEWFDRLYGEGDLEASYRGLARFPHFFAEAWRGRIRTFQLRTEDGLEHIEAARVLADLAPPDNPKDAMAAFLVELYAFECDVLMGRYTPDGPPLKPAISEQVDLVDLVQEFREALQELKIPPEGIAMIALTGYLRDSMEARVRLCMGEDEEALYLFRKLTRKHIDGEERDLALHYLGQAACEWNLGRRKAARQSLENASLALCCETRDLVRLRTGALLWALYDCVDEYDKAISWMATLDSTACPEATKKAALERGERLLEWVEREDRLVVF
jgi:hypothetical protein